MKRNLAHILFTLALALAISTTLYAQIYDPPPSPRPPVPELKPGAAAPAKEPVEFNRIDVTGPIDVEVKIGGEHKWIVKASRHLTPYVECVVEDQILVIKPKHPQPPKFLVSAKVIVLVTAPQIVGLESKGSGSIELTGKESDFLEVKSSGSGDVLISGQAADFDARMLGSGDLKAKNFNAGPARIVIKGSGNTELGEISDALGIELKGSGNVKITSVQAQAVTACCFGSGDLRIGGGSADKAEYAASGSGNIDAAKVKVRYAVATAKGSGNIKLAVSDSLTARTMGSGDITYFGDPKEKAVFEKGSGKIRQRK